MKLLDRVAAMVGYAPAPAAPALTDRRADGATYNRLTLSGVNGIDRGASRELQFVYPWTDEQSDLCVRSLGLGHRVVTLMSGGATVAGWRVDQRDRRDVARDADEDLNVVDRVEEWIERARTVGPALLVMITNAAAPTGLEGIETNGPAAQPMKDSERVVALQVYSGRYELSIREYESDPRSPNYRGARLWQITPLGLTGGGIQLVHASRCLYLAGLRIPPRQRMLFQGMDLSILELYRFALLRRDGLEAAAATLADAMDDAVFKVPGLAQLLAGDPTQAGLAMERWATVSREMGNVGVGVLDALETFERHPLTLGGFDHLDSTTRRALSTPEGWPQSQIFGDAPSGLNTDNESGRKQSAKVIAQYQSSRLRKPLLTLYSRILRVPRKELAITFNPTDPMTLSERVTMEGALATRDVALLGAGIVTAQEVRGRLDNDEPVIEYPLEDESLLAELTEDDIEEVDPVEEADE